ncbi:hypothetical protein SELMODRAFT_413204 [Selaginella moellendorffii]|uniref:Uncharacterized protein n=1 Tax=Selaginella moellendorffii TaxID=88036 RepID=D8RNP2_SELML|nr:hypothetical protein SELMODRAFT_413204 [Selaginella moellendorffii]
MGLRAVPITEENFRPFGQLLGKIGDGCEYGSGEAQLNLANGIPRFYLMELKKTGLRFKRITHHARVTQCLGSVGAHPWYMAVSLPSIVDPSSQHEGAVRSTLVATTIYLPLMQASRVLIMVESRLLSVEHERADVESIHVICLLPVQLANSAKNSGYLSQQQDGNVPEVFLLDVGDKFERWMISFERFCCS